jgi:PAS domain S-box-containing protein
MRSQAISETCPPGAVAPPRLAVLEARYRALFDHAQIGILLADQDSVYLDANPVACRMLGYTRAELVGLRAADIVAPDEAIHVDDAIAESLGATPHRRRWCFRRKDGSVFPAEVVATSLPDGTLLGTVRDLTERKLIDDADHKLAAIVAHSRDAIVGEDLDGRITSWNAGATATFGYTAEEMIGGTVAPVVPEALRAESAAFQAEARGGITVERVETQRVTRSGRVIEVSLTTAPIRDSEGRIVGISKFLRDITAAKDRGRELARMTRLHAALSQINQAIVQTTTRDALFDRVCRTLVEHGGFAFAWIGWHDPPAVRLRLVASAGDDGGRMAGIFISTEDVPSGHGPSGTAFRTRRTIVRNDVQADPVPGPWRDYYTRQGFRAAAAIPIRHGGTVRGTLNVYSDRADVFHEKEIALMEEAASDISYALDNQAREDARRDAEQRVLREKLFSDTMIESLPGILYFYDMEGRFLRWNRNFEEVSGYTTAEIAAMHPLDFFAAEERPLLRARIAAVFETGESSVEAGFRQRDGTILPYLFTGRRVEFDGRPCLLGAGIDISAQKLAEAEREQRHRAEAADRVKSAFLATMSHELRTPLNSIIGFTGILLQGLAGPLNTEQAKQLGMVQGSARHLLALVNDVLDISKIEAGQLRIAHDPFDPRPLIDRALASVAPQAAAKRVPVVARLEPALGMMIGDARRFEQVLLNLLSNAVKFTEQGRIQLDAALLPAWRPPEGGAPRPAIRIAVSDTGIGIRDEDMRHLFHPFRQVASGLARQVEGTGLGLAICRRLAALMGGVIGAESRWGEGSTFHVTLPIHGPA